MDENRIKEYALENGQTFTAYIPENVSNDTPIFYYSYVVGSNYETDTIWQGMEEDMAQYAEDAIIIIPHDKQLVIGGENVATHKYQTNAINAFNLVKEDLNIETTQFINGGFSAGFGYGTRTLAHYLQENPDAERQVLIAVDGVINPQANLQASELQALKDNNTLIISFTQQKNHQYQANLFASTDLPILYVVDNSIPEYTPDSQYWGIHDQVAIDFYDKDIYGIIIDFALGKSELVLPEGYSLRYYDPTTKQITEITAEEAANLLGITSASNISPTLLNSLKNLADITVESDDKTLENYLNEIRSTIRNTTFLDGDFSKSDYTSTTNVPSKIPELIATYFTSTSQLLSKIAALTTEFAKIAQSIEALDENLTTNLEKIDDNQSLNSNPTETAIADTTTSILTGAALAGVTSVIENTQNITASYAPQSPTTNNNSSNTTTNSKTQNTNNSQRNSSKSQPTTTEENTPSEEFLNYDELYSDETKIVYNNEDEYKIVIHKDGDKITGIEHYYSFETEEEATLAISELTNKYNANEDFEQIIQNDRYIKVLFKKESYETLTLTDIKEQYSNLEEIIKGGPINV